ncbi:hypothetical protein INT46_007182 [Mucor plumbeus]|uniref:DASH complex subunit DAD4 n=1 Tax=Mucor plumbeus TaxID=97098 RepID=A0A8H7R9E2_9FUNG|nr:hypothetical protein INT46_007182 [Mucor plumbeus]
MNNPHEQQQNALIHRIIENVGNLNKSIELLNDKLENLNKENSDIVLVSDMWKAYNGSVRIHIDNTKEQTEKS